MEDLYKGLNDDLTNHTHFVLALLKGKNRKFLLKRNSIQYLYELITGLIKNILPIRGWLDLKNTFTELKYQKYTLNIFI